MAKVDNDGHTAARLKMLWLPWRGRCLPGTTSTVWEQRLAHVDASKTSQKQIRTYRRRDMSVSAAAASCIVSVIIGRYLLNK